MFENILVPIDLNPKAYAASMYALNIAHKYNAKLFLLNISDKLRSKDDLVMSRVSVSDLENGFKEYALNAKHFMKDLLDDKIYNKVKIKYFVREGKPTNQIIDFANDNRIDLIVMGTNGKDSISDHLLGSTSSNIVAKSNVPVLTVPMI